MFLFAVEIFKYFSLMIYMFYSIVLNHIKKFVFSNLLSAKINNLYLLF